VPHIRFATHAGLHTKDRLRRNTTDGETTERMVGYSQLYRLYSLSTRYLTSGMRPFFRQPIDDVVACLEPIVTIKNPARALVPLFLSLIISWVIYVPIHELLHALACVATGGEVTRLEISAIYGGTILAESGWFPFVVSVSEYAGRLSGFDTKGSDFRYLMTDFGPYVLTVLIGVPLLKLAGRGRRPILVGAAIVVGLAPFYSLPGDYFEMGSIVATRASTPLARLRHPREATETTVDLEEPCPEIEGSPTAGFRCLRSDDVFKLIGQLCTQPSELGLKGAGDIALAVPIILVSLAFALLFAFATYMLGHYVSRVFVRPQDPTPSARPVANA